MQTAVVPLFPYYVQTAQPLTSTKVHASAMTSNAILMIYQLTGAYIHLHETWHLEPIDVIWHYLILFTLLLELVISNVTTQQHKLIEVFLLVK